MAWTTGEIAYLVAYNMIGTVSDDPAYTGGVERYGWEILKEILDVGGGPCPWNGPNKKDVMKGLKTPGWRIRTDWRGATDDSKLGIHWCGVFAAYALVRAGLPVKWGWPNIRPRDSNWMKRYDSWDKGFNRSALKTGDVAAIPKLNHHFIIEDASSSWVKAVAGNATYQEIVPQEHRRSDIYLYYKIL